MLYNKSDDARAMPAPLGATLAIVLHACATVCTHKIKNPHPIHSADRSALLVVVVVVVVLVIVVVLLLLLEVAVAIAVAIVSVAVAAAIAIVVAVLIPNS